MTSPVCLIKSLYYRPNTDHFLYKKTDQIQTVSPEITDQNLKCHGEECKTEKMDTVFRTIVQKAFTLTSSSEI